MLGLTSFWLVDYHMKKQADFLSSWRAEKNKRMGMGRNRNRISLALLLHRADKQAGGSEVELAGAARMGGGRRGGVPLARGAPGR